jgi:F-type H+-transporting ATPase subunit a
MAQNPFDHVMDTNFLAFFETQNLVVHLPRFYIPGYGYFQITRFMVFEVVAAALLLAIYVPLARRARDGSAPRGYFWNTFEVLLTFIRDRVAKPNIGEHDADRFVPYLWTVFLFILFLNVLGLIPFFGSPTASIAVTGVLALCAFLVIHVSGVLKLGVGAYLKSFVPHLDMPFGMGYVMLPGLVFLEVFGALIKAFVLAVRLFANLFAGHSVAAFILFFIVMAENANPFLFGAITVGSVLGVAALSLLELFVAFLQAFIFTFLTSLFIGSALHPHH